MSRALVQHKPLRRALLLAGMLAGLVLGASVGAGALTYTFTTLDPPGSASTGALGINTAGQIVGDFVDATGNHGFLCAGGSFRTLDVPGSFSTFAIGINDVGQIVGAFDDATERRGRHGFLYAGGSFRTLDVPDSVSTDAVDINAAGQIVGAFIDATRQQHGFLYTGGSFRTLDPPGSTWTFATGINTAGQIVGDFVDATGNHGFRDTGGSFTTIDVPGSSETTAFGINTAGQIVGFFRVGSAGSVHGFLDTGGNFSTIDVPGSTSTNVRGINDTGQIVGVFLDATGYHGFVATPVPEPTVSFAAFTATLALKFGPRIEHAFALRSHFILGTSSDGIDLSKDAVTLELKHGTASLTTTIPAGSFTKDKRGRFTFKGTINGVKLDATLTPLGSQRYAFTAEGKHADLSGLAHPVTVTLTIGDDRGSTTGTAEGKHPHKERS